MRIRSLALPLVALAFCATTALSTGAEGDKPKSGAQLFVSLCASCHGEQARGDGPVAPLLVTPPSDLTRIAQRNGGRFTADTIAAAGYLIDSGAHLLLPDRATISQFTAAGELVLPLWLLSG